MLTASPAVLAASAVGVRRIFGLSREEAGSLVGEDGEARSNRARRPPLLWEGLSTQRGRRLEARSAREKPPGCYGEVGGEEPDWERASGFMATLGGSCAPGATGRPDCLAKAG